MQTIIAKLREFSCKLVFIFYYFRNPPWDTGISPPELMDFIESHPPGRAVDLGCGTGTNVITLAKHGWQVTGVDFVPKAIQSAKRKIDQAGVDARVFQGDVTNLDLPEKTFDLALDIGCYHNLSSSGKQSYEQNLSRFLSLDGYFLLYAFTSTSDGSFGITQTDLARLNAFLEMEYRQDGQNRNRPSAWFKFKRKYIAASKGPVDRG